MHSRKINVVLSWCISLEVPFFKNVKEDGSIGIVNRAVSAFADVSSHAVAAEALAGARQLSCEGL